jgi:hypothetical protein
VVAALQELQGEVGEPAFDLVDPAGVGRRVVDVESRVRGQPGDDGRALCLDDSRRSSSGMII